MKTQSEIQKLMTMLKAGGSAPLAVAEAMRQLNAAGFEELEFQKDWALAAGGKYYVNHNDTSLFAFTIGNSMSEHGNFRIAAAHTDYPCLRVKPNPDVKTAGYAQINVEVYGGPILNTWLDRPLSISGRVAVRSKDMLHPDMRLIDVERPLMVIPNLAIHLNREVNKGVELNRQTDLLPILGTIQKDMEQEHVFLDFLAEELSVPREDILDYELWIKCAEEPRLVGVGNELLVAPRLDNLTSVQALLSAVINGNREDGCNLIALFDHEEVGNRSKQGAASFFLRDLMEKICECFGRTGSRMKTMLYDSMMLSVDVAQGTHPNYLNKMDIVNHPVLNGGFCIKEACAQSYATDCEAVAVVEQICLEKNIPYQKFVNRSDLAGGGTLGTVMSTIIPVPTVDIGVPILAMHSAVETMGVKDQESITELITQFLMS